MDLNKAKNEKGITLIALAVTIVVLLILAGVTISSVFSENGIIKKAQQAENAIEKAQANDLNELAKLEEQMEQYINSNDTAGTDLSEYATLGFQAYVTKKTKQKCDYMQMYVEISDVNNENDKITYAIGTDWKENIVKEGDTENNLFLKGNSQLEMLRVFENDNKYSDYYDPNDDDDDAPPLGKQISKEILNNMFTDVKISNLYVKKGKNYNIKIKIKTAGYNQNTKEFVESMVCMYNIETGNITDNTFLEITEKIRMLYDVNLDKGSSSDDATLLGIIKNDMGDGIPVYYAKDTYGNIERVLVLIDDNGYCVNDEAKKYLGFDYDRNGYIDIVDVNTINAAMSSGRP